MKNDDKIYFSRDEAENIARALADILEGDEDVEMTEEHERYGAWLQAFEEMDSELRDPEGVDLKAFMKSNSFEPLDLMFAGISNEELIRFNITYKKKFSFVVTIDCGCGAEFKSDDSMTFSNPHDPFWNRFANRVEMTGVDYVVECPECKTRYRLDLNAYVDPKEYVVSISDDGQSWSEHEFDNKAEAEKFVKKMAPKGWEYRLDVRNREVD